MNAPVRPRIVFLFSGQGAQYYQMGRDLYDAHPVFRRVLDEAETVVREAAGFSLLDRVFGAPASQPMDDLATTHPALVAVGLALYETLRSEGVTPDLLLGSSLGELVAATAAGCCTPATALRFAVAHARCVVEHSGGEGGMLAVLGPLATLQRLSDGGREAYLVGENFPGHFTISGSHAVLARIEAELAALGVTFVRLPVRTAFHSPLVQASTAPFLAACKQFDFAWTPRIPLVSTLTTARVGRFTPEHFAAVVAGPLRFRDTLLALEREGPAYYVDCGPAGTMATFVKHNPEVSMGSQPFPILTPFRNGRRNLDKLIDQLRAQA